MQAWLERTELLWGAEKLEQLATKHVLVVGLGGVGAYAAEMLARAGVGALTIVDGDVVNASNINRQLPALHSHIGASKAELMASRLRDINPEIQLRVINRFMEEDHMEELFDVDYDFVVDAIDTLTPKIHLIVEALKHGAPLISSMGAGGKTDPSQVMISDIKKSYNCKLARMLRKRLTKHKIKTGFQVVFSPQDIDKKAVQLVEGVQNKVSNVGTVSYMPALFGIHCAAHVLQQLTLEGPAAD